MKSLWEAAKIKSSFISGPATKALPPPPPPLELSVLELQKKLFFLSGQTPNPPLKNPDTDPYPA